MIGKWKLSSKVIQIYELMIYVWYLCLWWNSHMRRKWNESRGGMGKNGIETRKKFEGTVIWEEFFFFFFAFHWWWFDYEGWKLNIYRLFGSVLFDDFFVFFFMNSMMIIDYEEHNWRSIFSGFFLPCGPSLTEVLISQQMGFIWQMEKNLRD